MPKAKLTELEFRALVFQFDTIDQQIEMMQKSKEAIIKGFDLTMPAFYTRRKNLGLNSKVLERAEREEV
jgi:hypothetical protein